MDLFRILNELRSRKAEVEKLIAPLERLPVEHVTITTKLLRSSTGTAWPQLYQCRRAPASRRPNDEVLGEPAQLIHGIRNYNGDDVPLISRTRVARFGEVLTVEKVGIAPPEARKWQTHGWIIGLQPRDAASVDAMFRLP